MDSDRLRLEEARIKWAPGLPCEGAILRGKDMPGHDDDTVVSCAKTAEPIEMPFGCGLGWAEGTM